jgi:hypothetical protein
MYLFIKIILRDKCIVDFRHTSDIFDSIWGSELKRQGFVRLPNYQVRPQKGESYFTALWLKDTGEGYTYYIMCDQSEDSKILDIILRVEPNAPDYTKNKKKVKFKEYYFQQILLNDILSYRKSVISHYLSAALTQWNQDNFFTQFSTIPKPFDTIRPKDLKEKNQLVTDLLEYSVGIVSTDECLLIIAVTAIQAQDKQLLQECIDELDSQYSIEKIIHMAKEHHIL